MPEEKKAEQSQETPEVKDTDAMSLDELRQHIIANPETKDKSKEDSKETVDEESDEVTEEPEETVETDSDEEDKTSEEEEPENKVEPSAVEKELEQTRENYKELQRQFTKDRQEMKAVKEQLEVLKGLSKPTQEEEDALADLRKTNPEGAATLEKVLAQKIKKLEEQFEAKLQERVKPVEDGINNSVITKNITGFQESVEKFLQGEYKELEPEVTKIINGDLEHWQEVIKTNPNAFDLIWKEVAIANLDKVSAIRYKAKKVKSKEKENATPGSKSKVSAPSAGELTSEKIKGMSFDDLEKLRTKGAFKVHKD